MCVRFRYPERDDAIPLFIPYVVELLLFPGAALHFSFCGNINARRKLFYMLIFWVSNHVIACP